MVEIAVFSFSFKRLTINATKAKDMKMYNAATKTMFKYSTSNFDLASPLNMIKGRRNEKTALENFDPTFSFKPSKTRRYPKPMSKNIFATLSSIHYHAVAALNVERFKLNHYLTTLIHNLM